MGTEVLRPQDCLIERVRFAPAVFHLRRKGCYGNGNANPRIGTMKPAVRSGRLERRRQKQLENSQSEPLVSRRSASYDDLKKNRNSNNNNNSNLVMGQVTILKRGESPEPKIKAEAAGENRRRARRLSADDPIMCGIDRLGPDPEMVLKQLRIGDLKPVLPQESPYAGGNRSDMYAGSAFSMSPSPRSLPLPSFFNKKQVSKTVDDSATRDLRRLLRLE